MTTDGSIQNYTIPNMNNINDDPMFSVHGDIVMNWLYGTDNRVWIALTGGYFSAFNATDVCDHYSDGLGMHLHLNGQDFSESANDDFRIEISNIQSYSLPCEGKKQKVQGKVIGKQLTSGEVYGNYAIYVSNSTTEFPSDQRLSLVMRSKRLSFMIAYLFF